MCCRSKISASSHRLFSKCKRLKHNLRNQSVTIISDKNVYKIWSLRISRRRRPLITKWRLEVNNTKKKMLISTCLTTCSLRNCDINCNLGYRIKSLICILNKWRWVIMTKGKVLLVSRLKRPCPSSRNDNPRWRFCSRKPINKEDLSIKLRPNMMVLTVMTLWAVWARLLRRVKLWQKERRKRQSRRSIISLLCTEMVRNCRRCGDKICRRFLWSRRSRSSQLLKKICIIWGNGWSKSISLKVGII